MGLAAGRGPDMKRSTAVAVVATPFQIAATRTRARTPLRDLDIAPENLRFGEPPDDDIPLLAETLYAAGQLQPLTVRPGRKTEASQLALDGRRRLLALRLLLQQGRIDDAFPVDVLIETDPARQAAAVLLTNTAVPVHIADVIAAIGRMLKGRLGVTAIARALGHAEIDVKRMAALAALPDVALEALRRGRLNLRQARLLARLPDREEQAELAQMTLDGHGFPDWRVTERLDRHHVNARDPRFALVGAERYAAAGGRTETDLFGERPPVLLDPSILTEVWTKRAREIAAMFEAEGLAVHIAAGPEPDLSDDLEPLAYVYGGDLPADQMSAYRELRGDYNDAADALENLLGETTDADVVDPAVATMVWARLRADQAGWPGRRVTALVLRPSARTGIEVTGLAPVEPELDAQGAVDDGATPLPASPHSTYRAPEADAPMPETEGVNHALHAVRTDVATRGLIRALADDPGTALTALIARLFGQVAVGVSGRRPEAALALTASAFKPSGGRVIESLDGDVWRRIEERRAAWEASGQTVIGWVNALAHGDKMALLAELTALTLDLREERTTLVRPTARAEAAELADLCGADIALHWTPDAEFLKPHSKPLLLKMLEEMGRGDVRAGLLRKADLIAWVEENAAESRWAPASLSWTAPSEDPDTGFGVDDAPEDSGDPEEGPGAFEVTPEGEAALEATA